MIIYRHKQIATVILVVLSLGLVLVGLSFINLLATDELRSLHALCMLTLSGLVLAVCLLLFYAMTIEVRDDGTMLLRFGIGIITRRIDLSEVRSITPVTNPWYYGWGIRLVPGGWLYNVSGTHAVELLFANGKKIRIGTDEPERLVIALNNAVKP